MCYNLVKRVSSKEISYMFDIKLLSEKIIFDEDDLNDLRAFLKQNAESTVSGHFSTATVNEALYSHLNDHLRGIEFNIRQVIVKTILSDYIFNADTHKLTYLDIAKIMTTLNLGPQQLLKNLQGWILMSTEYALPEKEIAISLSESKLTAADHFDPIFDSNSDAESQDVPSLPIYNEQLKEPEPVDMALEVEDAVEVQTASRKYLKSDIIHFNPIQWISQYKIQFRYGFIIVISTLLFFSVILKFESPSQKSFDFRDICFIVHRAEFKPKALQSSVRLVYETSKAGVPSYLQFKSIDLNRLKGYLKRNNSLLSNDPYFNEIVNAAAKLDVNPLLLFAITGQEQSFVKRGSENAALIVNNPFNVYHSWVDYNTNIKDSSIIAANTVVNQLLERPANIDPFEWLNRIYAEDPNWHIGVEQIFLSLDAYCNIE